MSMNGKGGGDSTGLGKRKIKYQQQNRTPRKKTNHFNKHRCQRFTYWFKNLKIVTWSVGGMVGETRWRIFVEWVKKENPDEAGEPKSRAEPSRARADRSRRAETRRDETS